VLVCPPNDVKAWRRGSSAATVAAVILSRPAAIGKKNGLPTFPGTCKSWRAVTATPRRPYLRRGDHGLPLRRPAAPRISRVTPILTTLAKIVAAACRGPSVARARRWHDRPPGDPVWDRSQPRGPRRYLQRQPARRLRRHRHPRARRRRSFQAGPTSSARRCAASTGGVRRAERTAPCTRVLDLPRVVRGRPRLAGFDRPREVISITCCAAR